MHFRLRSSVACVVTWSFAAAAVAQTPVSLLDREAKNYGYAFNNGAEFPGAVGSLDVDESAVYEGKPSLKLHGDFTGGGGYVQAGRKLKDVDLRDLTLTIRNPGVERFTLRVGDASGQTHQIVVKCEPTEGWQKLVLPLARYFEKRGQADAVTNIAKYEYWGGAKDGRWHGPATGIYLLLGKTEDSKIRTLWVNDVTAVPRPTAVAGAETRVTLPLGEIAEGTHEWNFTNGPEFKGAKGSLDVVADDRADGASCFRLNGDFSGGGAYVAMNRTLPELELQDVTAFRLRVKSDDAASATVQLVDGAGQTHQRRGFKLPADGAWNDLEIVPTKIAGGEHWGGPNDGQWRGPPRRLQIALTKSSDPSDAQASLLVADVTAEAVLPVYRQEASYAANFDGDAVDLTAWKTEGDVKPDDVAGNRALKLSRTLENVNDPCSATSPKFTAAPGRWEIKLATKCDLRSPDSSYSAVVALECLDGADKVVERITLTDQFDRVDRQAVQKIVDLPPGTVAARFVARLNKTYGVFWLDDLAATRLAPAAWQDDRVARLLFGTAQLGNLLYPEDSRKVSLRVEAKRPLADGGRQVTCEVRDYWGARQAAPVTLPLVRDAAEKGIVYTAELDLADVPLAVGRYYEVHAAIPLGDAEPFRNFTSLAILPEAPNRQFKPDEVPFTARNWDNRIPQYIRLTDRLGVRICGLWGGWSSKPPYKPEAPGLELCRELGMGWLTTTPAKFIERANTEYDETALRQGVRNFIEAYGDERPLVINLGNEPHGTGEVVKRNVAAYKILYDEIKKIDSTIPVVATSVEPNEEYFAAGYGEACDAFDFHIYEDSSKVRRTIEAYRALQKKYDCVKPIWSTELGLNSQGQTRHTVAVELVKKFCTFFAAGGENVSWFGLLYPDPEGKSYGSSGDSHNVFDCRFNRYAPRLDAVMYYHMVNAVGIKKFVEEKTYGDDLHAFLFRDRDGRCLQVLWKDTGREDVKVPLAGVGAVRVIYVDGRDANFDAAGDGATLSITTDPLLLLYEKGQDLAATLGKPMAVLDPPTASQRSSPTAFPSTTMVVRTDSLPRDAVTLAIPPAWTTGRADISDSAVSFAIALTDEATAREAEIIVKLGDRGELYHRVPIGDGK